MNQTARRFGLYLHVPFCSSRCGYCDFNTYTPGEIGSSTNPEVYPEQIARELALAAPVVAEHYGGDVPEATTIFVGGGTPSLLGAKGLAQLLAAVRDNFGIAPEAEITTEANPESTSPEFFTGLLEAGYTRVSLGLQSTSSNVLKILGRQHTAGRALAAAQEAAAAGFEHINVDLIYGTPGESEAELLHTVAQALALPIDHLSAYSLIVEDGTALARQVKNGQLPAPDDDVFAARYEQIDQLATAAGFSWYEVSNWAKPGGQCRHNLAYWRDENWYGAGPGAHSHLDESRFYNVKRPVRYVEMLDRGLLPVAGKETLSGEDRHIERLMLGLRLQEGIPRTWISEAATPQVNKQIAGGWLQEFVNAEGELRLAVSDRGRLLADGIIADILVAEGL